MSATVLYGDCLEMMRGLADASVDAIVTDPPAGIAFMGKDWDKDKGGRNQWVAWMQGVAAEALRAAKPGAHALVWALPRTSHWTATAWDNAGWEVRDRVAHMFGTGFPKSHNLKDEWDGWGTALKPAMEDWWLLRKPLSEKTVASNVLKYGCGAINIDASRIIPSSPVVGEDVCAQLSPLCSSLDRGAVSLEQSLGYLRRIVSVLRSCSTDGTDRWRSEASQDGNLIEGGLVGQMLLSRLLPSAELYDLNWSEALGFQGDCLSCRRFCDEQLRSLEAAAQEPAPSLGDALERTCSALRGLEHNRDCQCIGHPSSSGAARLGCSLVSFLVRGALKKHGASLAPHQGPLGRFPSHLIHDGSDEVLAAFAAFGERKTGGLTGDDKCPIGYGGNSAGRGMVQKAFGDTGTAARFFYSAKAGKLDRADSKHPTVKPISLMRYLCKLVTPPGGVVLDMFAGSGTTLQAALEEGFQAIGIEREREYHADILRRLERVRRAMEEPAPCRQPELSQRLACVSEADSAAHPPASAGPIDQQNQNTWAVSPEQQHKSVAAISLRASKPKKAPKSDWPTLFDLMECHESA